MFIDLIKRPCTSNILTDIDSFPAVTTCILKLLVVGFGDTLTFNVASSFGVDSGAANLTKDKHPVLATLGNFNANALLFPQEDDLYTNLILSPVAAPALLVNLTSIILDVSDPTIMVAVDPNVPTNDHFLLVTDATEPVADAAAGNTGAVKRYTLFPHTSVIGVAFGNIEPAAGAAGAVVTVLVNLTAADALLPHADVYNNLTLSPVAAAALLLNLTSITFDVSVPAIIVAA